MAGKLVLISLLCSLALSAKAGAQADFKFLENEDCRGGSERFASAFNRFFDSTGERVLALPEETVRMRMAGEGKDRYEIELIATPGLPQNYTFRVRRMACWMHLYDFNEALRKRNAVEATTHFGEWKGCVDSFYEGKAPSVVADLDSCFTASKQVSPEIPKVLPRNVKVVPPGASTPIPNSPVPGQD